MKLVMLGGTFNPPHKGHLKIAESVLQAFSYDKLVLIPSFIPAHKNIHGELSFQHRFNMVELAASDFPKIFVSACEYERKGVSYSIDTIRYLKDMYCDGEKPGLIIGDDLIQGFHRWHKAEELAHEADIIVCHRGDPSLINFPYPHIYHQNPIFSVSSTEVRKKISTGDTLEGIMDEKVMKYIRKNNLYVTS